MGDAEGPDDDVPPTEYADTSFGSEYLLELLSELRRRLEAVAPDDRDRTPDATELIRQAQERIATLEQMLGWARTREVELTTRTVRGEMRVAHLESAVGELNSIAKKTSEAEAGRLRAETKAAELHQQLTAARAELPAKEAEVGRLRARCRNFESDIATLADELASTMVARARAERLERERDVALERARAESRLALDERLRAAGAERQLEVLRDRLREVEQRSTAAASVTEAPDEGWGADVAAPPGEEPTEEDAIGEVDSGDTFFLADVEDVADIEDDEDDEVVELAQEPDVAEDETLEDDAVVDVTQEPDLEEDDAAVALDEAVVWGEPAKSAGFVGWLRRGIGTDHPDEDSEDRE